MSKTLEWINNSKKLIKELDEAVAESKGWQQSREVYLKTLTTSGEHGISDIHACKTGTDLLKVLDVCSDNLSVAHAYASTKFFALLGKAYDILDGTVRTNRFNAGQVTSLYTAFNNEARHFKPTTLTMPRDALPKNVDVSALHQDFLGIPASLHKKSYYDYELSSSATKSDAKKELWISFDQGELEKCSAMVKKFLARDPASEFKAISKQIERAAATFFDRSNRLDDKVSDTNNDMAEVVDRILAEWAKIGHVNDFSQVLGGYTDLYAIYTTTVKNVHLLVTRSSSFLNSRKV